MHTDQRRCNENKDHIDERGEDQIQKLSPRPCGALHAHEIVRYARAQKRDVCKQQNEQKRDQQHGVRVAEGPHKRLERLHGGAHIVGK